GCGAGLGFVAGGVAVRGVWVAVGVGAQRAGRRRRARRRAPDEGAEPAPRLAVVVNPSKQGAAGLQVQVRAYCSAHGLEEPLWYETSVDDPGQGPARRAIEAGADVVVAAGGDGTVRAVAETMVDSGVPMGVIPVGTGNLLARNLELPLTGVDEALDMIVHGRTRAIDVGWLRVTEFAPEPRNGDHPNQPDHEPDTGRRHIFLVIAGL